MQFACWFCWRQRCCCDHAQWCCHQDRWIFLLRYKSHSNHHHSCSSNWNSFWWNSILHHWNVVGQHHWRDHWRRCGDKRGCGFRHQCHRSDARGNCWCATRCCDNDRRFFYHRKDIQLHRFWFESSLWTNSWWNCNHDHWQQLCQQHGRHCWWCRGEQQDCGLFKQDCRRHSGWNWRSRCCCVHQWIPKHVQVWRI